jgi:imidazolonepropionase-like amidohydrolase
MTTVATWNVNSLKVRLQHVLDWLGTHRIDIVCLQETKLTDDAFPVAELEAAGYRAAFAGQKTYNEKRKEAKDGGGKRDLKLDTLAGAINGDIRVNIHCYRADEMAIMLDLAKEYGFKISAFHHGAEAYKIADRLATEGVCAALWADWWGFKMESFDGIQENIALVDRVPGGCAIVHSDSEEGIQRLNQEAAKVMANAKRVGIDIAPEHAIRWLTANPAKAMGIDGQTGTLEAGKMADVVLWNGNPFSSYAQAEQVYIDGARLYDRRDPARQPKSDFLLGNDLLGQDLVRGGGR